MRQTAIRWSFWAFAAVGLYYLLTEHRTHLLDYLPFVLLMACPLMHLLHGHGSHEPDRHGEQRDRPPAS
jgi:Protein of unknown function (DUF2933)